MATSTLIQQLGVAADGFGSSTSNRRQVETFLTTLTNGAAPAVPPVFVNISLAAGEWVALDSGKTGSDRVLYVEQAAAVGSGNTLVVGVVAKTVTASLAGGQSIDVPVEVVVAGYAENARVTTATATDIALVVDTTAGRADPIVAADLAPACGVTLEVAAANVADVWVFKRF